MNTGHSVRIGELLSLRHPVSLHVLLMCHMHRSINRFYGFCGDRFRRLVRGGGGRVGWGGGGGWGRCHCLFGTNKDLPLDRAWVPSYEYRVYNCTSYCPKRRPKHRHLYRHKVKLYPHPHPWGL